tara:strand:- start:60 stop:554 length:495 start_codon:yes stop_codon:yes gene_type:complete
MSQKDIKNFIISGFNLIKHSADLTYKNKADSISYLFGIGSLVGILPGWRPKAISHNALCLFVENNFKYPRGLERAHEHHRRDTLYELINNDWNSDDEWWNFFYERDFTILSTRSENRDERNFNQVISYAIPLEENLFLGKKVGFVYSEKEKIFLANLAVEKNLM